MSSTASTRAPLRVLVVTSMYPSPERPARGAFVAAQVEALQAAGVDVQPLVFAPGGGLRGYLGAVSRIRRAVRDHDPHVVHAHYGLMAWSASWQGRPLVTSFCGDDLLGTVSAQGGVTAKSLLGIAMSQFAATRSAAIICKSNGLRLAIRSQRARERAAVIPNGVDTARFAPGDRLAARRALGLPGEARLVLFPNTPTEPNKRIDLARAAVDLARREIPDAELLVLQDATHAQMPLYYQAADVVVLTSRREGSPNVVKEALACGTPVVTTDVGDVRRWVLPGCGAIVDGDAASVAGALTAILLSPPLVDRSHIERELSSAAIAGRIIDLYRAVMDRAPVTLAMAAA